MDRFLQDLRFSLRMLGRNPAFTAVAVLALALGIGGNAAIFSVVDGVLLKPLALPAADRLVVTQAVSVPDFLDWREQSRVFSGMAAWNATGLNWTGRSEPQRLRAALVSPGFFSTLDVGPALGRAFSAAEHRPGGPQAVVLADGLWQRAFGGDPGVLGRALTLGGASYTVVGVLPRNFRFVGTADVWVPYRFDDPASYNRGSNFLSVVARLAPGVSLRRARTEMADIVARLERLHPENAGRSVQWTPLPEELVANVRRALLALLAAVGLVLLIACADVANLLLARAAARRREIAVRTALGASRWQLVRQLLAESLLLSLAGGGLGLLLAAWGVRYVAALHVAKLPLPTEALRIDSTVLLFTLGLALATGLLFGLAPALRTSRTDTQQVLREGGRSGAADRSGASLRRGLVIVEIALALALLAGAGLLVRSFARLAGVDPGFRPDHLLTFRLSLPEAKYKTPESQAAFFDEVLGRLAAASGVRAVGATSVLPFGGSWSTGGLNVEGYQPPPNQPGAWGDIRIVTPGFFQALGVPLLKGLPFTAENGPEAVPVAVVDEEFVRRYWPRTDPLGKRVAFPANPGQPTRWMQVIGVVGHTKHEGLDADARIQLYLPYRQAAKAVGRGVPAMSFAVRTGGDALGAANSVRAIVHAVDRDLPVYALDSMENLLASSVAQRRFSMILLGVFSGLALLLASIGIYGVMSYSVAQRGHELGVRMALGAAKPAVVGLVLRQGMTLALCGLAIGLAGAFALTRLLASQLFSVRATDPPTFVLVTALLAVVALLANLLPALRATRVDPVVALREE